MNNRHLSKFFNECNFVTLAFFTSLVLLIIQITARLLDHLLETIGNTYYQYIFAVFLNKIHICILILIFSFIILSFFNIVQDTNGKIRFNFSSSFIKILFKLFSIIFLIIYSFLHLPSYMFYTTILVLTLVCLSFLIYFSRKIPNHNYICSNCGAYVLTNQKFCKKCGNKL